MVEIAGENYNTIPLNICISNFFILPFYFFSHFLGSLCNEEEVSVPAGSEKGELGTFRTKLLNFLEISDCYQPERLISDFPFDGELILVAN